MLLTLASQIYPFLELINSPIPPTPVVTIFFSKPIERAVTPL